MIHLWIWVGFGLVVIISSYFLSAPTWLVERLTTRFKLHPELMDADVASISRGEERIIGPGREQVIEAFNTANFLGRHETCLIPRHEPNIVLDTQCKGKHQRYTLYPEPPFIDVVKEANRKTIIYRVDSHALMQQLDPSKAPER